MSVSQGQQWRVRGVSPAAEKTPSVLNHAATPSRAQFQISYRWIDVLGIVADCAIITSASVASGVGYHEVAWGGTGPIDTFAAVGCLVSVTFCGVSTGYGSYTPQRLMAFRKQVNDVLTAWSLVGFALLTVAFLLKTTDAVSRGATIMFFVVGLALLLGWRAVIARFMKVALQHKMFGAERIILVTERTLRPSARKLPRNGYLPVRTFEIEDAHDSFQPAEHLDELVTEVIEASRAEGAFGVVLLLSWQHQQVIDTIAEGLGNLPVWIRLLPDPNVARYGQTQMVLPAGMWAAELKRGPLCFAEQAAKRALDLAVASSALVLLFPLLAAVAILVKLETKGPALFRQTRVGLNGVAFEIFKYRTMFVMENGASIRQATKNDPRVTRVGRWLRQTSFDELPQLLNVLKGDMSIVGPRPHAIAHNTMFEVAVANYAARYQMKPGITGLAQVHGFRGETRTAETILRRIELDLLYVRTWSFWLDIQLLARTIVAVCFQRMAY